MEGTGKLWDLPVYDSRYVGQIWLDALLLSVFEVSGRRAPWDWGEFNLGLPQMQGCIVKANAKRPPDAARRKGRKQPVLGTAKVSNGKHLGKAIIPSVHHHHHVHVLFTIYLMMICTADSMYRLSPLRTN